MRPGCPGCPDWIATEELLRAHQDPRAEYPYLTGRQWAEQARGRGRHRRIQVVSLEAEVAWGREPVEAPVADSVETAAAREAAWRRVEPLLREADLTLAERVAWVLRHGDSVDVTTVARALGETEARVEALARAALGKLRAAQESRAALRRETEDPPK